MAFVLENLRLKELVAVVNLNRGFYEDFQEFLKQNGYENVYAFVQENSDSNATRLIEAYLVRPSAASLYDGLGRPYNEATAKWYFLAWILRDAPAQRLQPLVSSLPGATLIEKRAYLLNKIRTYLRPLFDKEENWLWPAVSEVMLARLEGSRRSLKGTRFEEIVRAAFRKVFLRHALSLQIGEGEKRINDETYDVQITNAKKDILVPVKTRETMGGGHANLFTRDIFKAISVAHENGYECIPVVIAESWGGDLKSLQCKHCIYIPINPNQIEAIGTLLDAEIEKMVPFLKAFMTSN
jgi:hypothetical protein